MKKLLFFILFLISISFNAYADNTLPKPPLESPSGIYIKWELLNLTQEQKKRIINLRYQFQQKVIKLKSEIQAKQLEIERQLILPNSNPEVIKKLLREKLSLEAELQMEALENFLSIKALLTNEQLQKLPLAIILK